ncbi:hypothetical protein GOB94_05965 [Granulicella sp. 5B5]|uniref:hypothetical protein n=1 Tax=Granulicella sp. 5B5 TaxID=1617967 RepID=UPI0015F4863D|nr:hypothetical protein [Granulicella sp. 5B5]QMV18288.1 hypothetical protein GOB94_05965 [Granulicella sp. 5B5]
MADEQKLAFNARVKASMLIYLKSLSWPEKIASIERMNEAGRIARAAMKAARSKSSPVR